MGLRLRPDQAITVMIFSAVSLVFCISMLFVKQNACLRTATAIIPFVGTVLLCAYTLPEYFTKDRTYHSPDNYFFAFLFGFGCFLSLLQKLPELGLFAVGSVDLFVILKLGYNFTQTSKDYVRESTMKRSISDKQLEELKKLIKSGPQYEENFFVRYTEDVDCDAIYCEDRKYYLDKTKTRILKLLKPIELNNTEETKKGMPRLLQTVSKVCHSNIVPFKAVGKYWENERDLSHIAGLIVEHNDSYQKIEDLSSKRGQISETHVLQWSLQLARAIMACHQDYLISRLSLSSDRISISKDLKILKVDIFENVLSYEFTEDIPCVESPMYDAHRLNDLKDYGHIIQNFLNVTDLKSELLEQVVNVCKWCLIWQLPNIVTMLDTKISGIPTIMEEEGKKSIDVEIGDFPKGKYSVKTVPRNNCRYKARELRISIEVNPGSEKHPNILKYVGYQLHRYIETGKDQHTYSIDLVNGLIVEHLEKSERYNIILNDVSKDLQYFLTIDRVHEWASQLAAALAHCHARSIMHRKISPEVLLFEISGDKYILKLTDFSTARIEAQDHTSGIGIARYKAPEMLNSNDYDHKVDCWSYGAVVFTMLFKREPFKYVHLESDAIRSYATNPSSFGILAEMVEWDEEKLKRQQDIFEKQSDKRELAVFQAILACLCINPKDRKEMIEIEKLLSK